jgi:hypothetical protein
LTVVNSYVLLKQTYEYQGSHPDNAERLFARDGFEATSLRAITAEAGVNLATVNYHFPSRSSIP